MAARPRLGQLVGFSLAETPFFEDDQPAPQRLDQWERRPARSAAAQSSRRDLSRMNPKEKQQPTRLHKTPAAIQYARLHTDRSDGHEIRADSWRSGRAKQFFEPDRCHLCIRQLQRAHCFAKEHRFSCLRLDHQESQLRSRELQRDRGRAAAASISSSRCESDGTCRAARIGSMSSRSNASSAASTRFSELRLIFLFQAARRR